MEYILLIISSAGSAVVSSVLPIAVDMGGVILNSAIKTLTRELNIGILDYFLSFNFFDFFREIFEHPVRIEYTAECLTTVQEDDINKKVIIHKHMYDMRLGISNPVFFFAGVGLVSATLVFGTSLYTNDAISHIINNYLIWGRK